ncbi:hypothetical protein BJX68DRAFT_189448 [Aspergillus pseudodeflectus]|uniref:Uncharacterized protein n=1 Tax=Aspergillus pseudodeflectus TaxID=176178 RepID=A0ABR4JKJ0_9EURO
MDRSHQSNKVSAQLIQSFYWSTLSCVTAVGDPLRLESFDWHWHPESRCAWS